MAALGFLIGVFLGSIATAYYSQVGFAYPGMEEMGAKFNIPSVIYPALDLLPVLLGPSVVFIFCLFASIYPAFKLYGLKPVEAMRAV